MVKSLVRYTAFLMLALFLGACNLGKWMPEGEYRLEKNTIKVDGSDAPENVYNILKQRPAPVAENWIYTWGNPNNEKGFSRWVSDLGTAPTLLSIPLIKRTQTQLGYYYFSKGYFYNVVSYEIEQDSAHRSAEVLYSVQLGPQYFISEIEYDIQSDIIARKVRGDTLNRVIELGDPYDEGKLEEERNRLTTLFRNQGFYGFSKDLIHFTADTTAGGHRVKVIMSIYDQPIRTDDSTYYVPHERYRIGEIYIDYGFNYLRPDVVYADTTDYRNYEFLIRDEPRYHPHLLTRAIHFENGDYYDATKIKNSYTHLSSLGVFGATEIEFVPRKDSAILDAFIKLTPLDKRSVTTNLEGTNTSGNYGIAGSVSLINRNLFKAGEIFNLSLKGGIQAQANYSQNEFSLFNTYEIVLESGLTFSRALIPNKYQELIPKRMRPTTVLNASYSQQTRVEFQRRILKLGLTYRWKETDYKTWQLALLDFNYVNLLDAEESYLNSLFFKTGFQDNLITALRVSYEYAPIGQPLSLSKHYFRTTVEGSGHVMNGLDALVSFPVNEETGQSTIFDVPYAEYVKTEIEYRHYLRMGPNSKFVSRVFAGVTYNTGNSPFLPPFEKNYLAGGSQDIRGWVAYRLGPGALPNKVYDTANYAAVAPIKLMVNLEYRFKIMGSLMGAVFADAGNVWLFQRDYAKSIPSLSEETVESMKFNPSTFIKNSALGTGFGLRYDFGFFQLRLDGGIKVWDPSEPDGFQYVLDGLQWRTVTYNFALGYPF